MRAKNENKTNKHDRRMAGDEARDARQGEQDNAKFNFLHNEIR